MALGTNDFSTPLKAGEAWPTREALQADFRQRYGEFLLQLRARYPQALLVVWATDGAAGEILTQAAAAVQQLQRDGERRIRLVPCMGSTRWAATGTPRWPTTGKSPRPWCR